MFKFFMKMEITCTREILVITNKLAYMINGLIIINHIYIYIYGWYCYYNNGGKSSEMFFISILDYKLEDTKTLVYG